VVSVAGVASPRPPAIREHGQQLCEFPGGDVRVVSFLQYAAELHEQDGYNAFDVTRGYINIQARLSDRVKVRFTPMLRPTTDASLERNLAMRSRIRLAGCAGDRHHSGHVRIARDALAHLRADGELATASWAVLLERA
jgi:hypothetical protein